MSFLKSSKNKPQIEVGCKKMDELGVYEYGLNAIKSLFIFVSIMCSVIIGSYGTAFFLNYTLTEGQVFILIICIVGFIPGSLVFAQLMSSKIVITQSRQIDEEELVNRTNQDLAILSKTLNSQNKQLNEAISVMAGLFDRKKTVFLIYFTGFGSGFIVMVLITVFLAFFF